MMHEQPKAKREQKFDGFDFLRAAFSIAIIAYKTKIFYLPELLISGSLAYALSAYVLSGMVGALAVPVFLQISLFLFYGKSEKMGFSYFVQKRLPRLLSLYLFWVISITIFDILFVEGFEVIRGATSSPKSFVEFIVSGNSTPYFFFFSLIFVTVLAEILILLSGRLNKRSTKTVIHYCLLLFSSVLVLTFSIIEPITNYIGVQSPFLSYVNNITKWDYNPFNFLPYVFTTAITVQEYNAGELKKVTKSLKLKLWSLFFLAVTFFLLEWILTSKHLLIQVDQKPLDHYMRLSLVFASWLLLYLALLSKLKVPKCIRFISECSLGIYGFHVFFTKKSFAFDSIPVLGNLFRTVPGLESITAFLMILIGSIALTLIFRRLKVLRNFV